MKKLISCLLILSMVFTLCACSRRAPTTGVGDATNSPNPSSTLPKAEPTNLPPAAPDAGDSQIQSARVPDKIAGTQGQEPTLKVYLMDTQSIEEMPIETYLEGVLAGEMKNDWPEEALKAQAILARTFVLKFVEEKTSAYEGAHISTDIKEAQAYDASGVNDRIKEAISSTRGQVLSCEGELPYTWFHAHAGGTTALAKEGLEFEKEEPKYTKIVASPESDKAPEEDANWSAEFTMEEVVAALKTIGVATKSVQNVSIGTYGDSGRATTFLFDGVSVPAGSFRLALDSMRMKSTLIESMKITDAGLSMKGKGYGHGVGLSQWGAYGMAEDGKKADEIIEHYFANTKIDTLWK